MSSGSSARKNAAKRFQALNVRLEAKGLPVVVTGRERQAAKVERVRLKAYAKGKNPNRYHKGDSRDTNYRGVAVPNANLGFIVSETGGKMTEFTPKVTLLSPSELKAFATSDLTDYSSGGGVSYDKGSTDLAARKRVGGNMNKAEGFSPADIAADREPGKFSKMVKRVSGEKQADQTLADRAKFMRQTAD